MNDSTRKKYSSIVSFAHGPEHFARKGTFMRKARACPKIICANAEKKARFAHMRTLGFSLRLDGGLDGRLDDGLHIGLNDALDGALDGRRDGGLDGALEDGLARGLDGKLHGRLDD